MTVKLIYIGRGDAFYHVPTRDLTDEDFAERAEIWAELGITEDVLISSGLYKKAENKKVALRGIQYGNDLDFPSVEKTVKPKQNKAAKEGE
jgi:hypothetical protein